MNSGNSFLTCSRRTSRNVQSFTYQNYSFRITSTKTIRAISMSLSSDLKKMKTGLVSSSKGLNSSYSLHANLMLRQKWRFSLNWYQSFQMVKRWNAFMYTKRLHLLNWWCWSIFFLRWLRLATSRKRFIFIKTTLFFLLIN